MSGEDMNKVMVVASAPTSLATLRMKVLTSSKMPSEPVRGAILGRFCWDLPKDDILSGKGLGIEGELGLLGGVVLVLWRLEEWDKEDKGRGRGISSNKSFFTRRAILATTSLAFLMFSILGPALGSVLNPVPVGCWVSASCSV